MKFVTFVLRAVAFFGLAVWSGANAVAFYDPGMGRWINRDPLADVAVAERSLPQLNGAAGNEGQAAHRVETFENPLFVFSGNNPISRIDPHGLDSPGCDGVPGFLESPCALECCAEHDRCFHVGGRNGKRCTSRSWLLIWNPCSRCGGCNRQVLACMAGCLIDGGDDPDRPNYYCGVHGVWFDDPTSEHMNHSTD